MVTLDWRLDRTEGVTLVELTATAERARRVRIENRLDGPVWPPREQGVPAPGWGDDGFEGVVPADGRLAIGYATPAPPDEPPAEVVSDEPATDERSAERAAGAVATDPAPRAGTGREANCGPAPDLVPSIGATPEGVVRSLGDPVVPRDAVPVPDGTERPSRDSERAAEPQTEEEEESDAASTDAPAGDEDPEPGPAVTPPAVRIWLGDVQRRLAAVEGPEPPPSDLEAVLAADRRTLERVSRRAAALASRAASAPSADTRRADRAPSDGPTPEGATPGRGRGGADQR